MLRNLLAIEYIGNRHWPSKATAVTEIGNRSNVPELSDVQQARQRLIFKHGIQIVRGRRITAQLESRATGQLTEQQQRTLQSARFAHEAAQLETIVRNFERRQAALRMAA